MALSKQAKRADKSNLNDPFSTLHPSVPVTSYLRRDTIVTEKERLRLASEKKQRAKGLEKKCSGAICRAKVSLPSSHSVATRQNESSCGDCRFEIIDDFHHGGEKSRKFFLHKSKVYHVIYQLKLQNHVYYTFKCV